MHIFLGTAFPHQPGAVLLLILFCLSVKFYRRHSFQFCNKLLQFFETLIGCIELNRSCSEFTLTTALILSSRNRFFTSWIHDT
jgi:hypothetical protein